MPKRTSPIQTGTILQIIKMFESVSLLQLIVEIVCAIAGIALVAVLSPFVAAHHISNLLQSPFGKRITIGVSVLMGLLLVELYQEFQHRTSAFTDFLILNRTSSFGVEEGSLRAVLLLSDICVARQNLVEALVAFGAVLLTFRVSYILAQNFVAMHKKD